MATSVQLQSYDKVLAGIERRTIARLIDIAVHAITSIAAIVVIMVIYGMMSGAEGTQIEAVAIRVATNGPAGTLLGVIGMLTYHAVSEAFGGASLGKRLLRIVVVMDYEQPCTVWAAIVRSAVFVMDGFLFALPGLMAMSRSDLQQRYGDQWAHTVVLKRSETQAQALKPTTTVWLGILLGIFCDFAIVTFARVLNLYR